MALKMITPREDAQGRTSDYIRITEIIGKWTAEDGLKISATIGIFVSQEAFFTNKAAVQSYVQDIPITPSFDFTAIKAASYEALKLMSDFVGNVEDAEDPVPPSEGSNP